MLRLSSLQNRQFKIVAPALDFQRDSLIAFGGGGAFGGEDLGIEVGLETFEEPGDGEGDRQAENQDQDRFLRRVDEGL